MSTRAFRSASTDETTFHARLLGTRGAIATENYLATHAGADILKAGGNAVDAAVAAVLVEGLVNPQMHTFGGECPILVRMAQSGDVEAVNGNTAAPQRATAQAYSDRGYSDVPDEGVLAAGVPAAPGALIRTLARHGRLSLAEVAAPAIELARNGFPLHSGMLNQEKFGIRALEQKFRREWPGSAALYLPDGDLPQVGQIFRNPALAATLEALVHAETSTRGDRKAGLDAAYRNFYQGDIANEIARFCKERDGFLERTDLAVYETQIETPHAMSFAGTTLYKCGFWTQGPTILQCLAMLERRNLHSLGHNSAEYLHVLIETIKLVYADREQYYGDPSQTHVPAEMLLSKDYAALRDALIDTGKAIGEMRPGDAWEGKALLAKEKRFEVAPWGHGTVHVDVIDSEGNMVAATPSGAWIKSAEVIPALGFPLGNRLMTFYLEPEHHPNRVAPFKRPRTTISPSLALRGDKPWMVFGSMGGDQQDQWQLQFYLNRVLFGMTIQQAIEAPKLSSENFPGFFAPHDRFPNRVRIEPRVGDAVLQELKKLGHEIEVATDWSEGYLLAASYDPDTGVLEAGSDPRGPKGDVFQSSAMCW